MNAIGPVSNPGRTMMASLQQAISKGMPPDQAIAYVKSMAMAGLAPLADLYSMMKQFERLKQPTALPPQGGTIKDQLNQAMAQQSQMQDPRMTQQGQMQDPRMAQQGQMQDPRMAQQMLQQGQMQDTRMERGLGGIDAGSMNDAQYAAGGIVAFAGGGPPTLTPNQILLQKLMRQGAEGTSAEAAAKRAAAAATAAKRAAARAAATPTAAAVEAAAAPTAAAAAPTAAAVEAAAPKVGGLRRIFNSLSKRAINPRGIGVLAAGMAIPSTSRDLLGDEGLSGGLTDLIRKGDISETQAAQIAQNDADMADYYNYKLNPIGRRVLGAGQTLAANTLNPFAEFYNSISGNYDIPTIEKPTEVGANNRRADDLKQRTILTNFLNSGSADLKTLDMASKELEKVNKRLGAAPTAPTAATVAAAAPTPAPAVRAAPTPAVRAAPTPAPILGNINFLNRDATETTSVYDRLKARYDKEDKENQTGVYSGSLDNNKRILAGKLAEVERVKNTKWSRVLVAAGTAMAESGKSGGQVGSEAYKFLSDATAAMGGAFKASEFIDKEIATTQDEYDKTSADILALRDSVYTGPQSTRARAQAEIARLTEISEKQLNRLNNLDVAYISAFGRSSSASNSANAKIKSDAQNYVLGTVPGRILMNIIQGKLVTVTPEQQKEFSNGKLPKNAEEASLLFNDMVESVARGLSGLPPLTKQTPTDSSEPPPPDESVDPKMAEADRIVK